MKQEGAAQAQGLRDVAASEFEIRWQREFGDRLPARGFRSSETLIELVHQPYHVALSQSAIELVCLRARQHIAAGTVTVEIKVRQKRAASRLAPHSGYKANLRQHR